MFVLLVCLLVVELAETQLFHLRVFDHRGKFGDSVARICRSSEIVNHPIAVVTVSFSPPLRDTARTVGITGPQTKHDSQQHNDPLQ